DVGYYIPGTKWEVDARHDVYNRLEDDVMETQWVTTTLGVQYHFNLKTRLTFNYIMRDVKAVNFSAATGPNEQL
ncbi:MAG: phosphate-selective porin O and P, partial [Gammaproteobacteria bacterium]|nr:phosphate-selective porin O and P [Gammaproteobacteria bacterium]